MNLSIPINRQLKRNGQIPLKAEMTEIYIIKNNPISIKLNLELETFA